MNLSLARCFIQVQDPDQALAFFEFLKREAPGFSQSYIVDIPPQLGIRETRRIRGAYRLTREDVLSCASFDGCRSTPPTSATSRQPKSRR